MIDCESDSAVLWEHRFEDLRQWKELHGDCNVPKAEGKLGRWVVRQRELHKKSKLEPERQIKLDRLGFVWNTNEAAWEHKYALLVKYNEAHNHCCVPISDSTLGMWVAKMRANRRRNKLAQHRIDKLNAINFVWNTAEADWMDKYNRLLEFRSINSHSCVPFNEGELGWWVNTQRQNKRKGKLVPHREALLNEAEFVWAPQEFLAARRRYQAAQRANAAHRLSASADSYYRNAVPVYGNHVAQFSHQYGRNFIGHSPIGPPHGYVTNPQKRRHPSYLDNCHPSGDPSQSDPTMLSPTSVKRVKLLTSPVDHQQNPNWSATSPIPLPTAVPSNHVRQVTDWGSYYQPPPQSLPASRSATDDSAARDSKLYTQSGRISKESKSDGHSIASLLSPSPNQLSPVSVNHASVECNERDSLPVKFSESSSTAGVLSSICGLPRMNVNRLNPCSPNDTTDNTRNFVLPPISSLRGFDLAKTGDANRVP